MPFYVPLEELQTTDIMNRFLLHIVGLYALMSFAACSGTDDVKAVDPVQQGQTAVVGQKKYVHKVLGMQFTSAYCQACPGLTSSLKEVEDMMPGVLVPISFHLDYNDMSDPMTVSASSTLMRKYGFNVLPYFVLNFRDGETGVGTDKDSVLEAVRYEQDQWPVECGVALKSEYDAQNGKVAVTVRVASNVEGRYRCNAFLVEDGIDYLQVGVADGETYLHNNVVRKMMSVSIEGSNLGSGLALEAGTEYPLTFSSQLDPSWNSDAMRVVAVAMATEDEGRTYYCANVNSCALQGGESDYLTE